MYIFKKSKQARAGCWEQYLHLRGRKWQEPGEDCKMRSFITCMLHEILLGWSSQGRCNGWGM